MAEAVDRIIQWMEEWAPRRLAAGWDRVGLQVGDPRQRVKGILVALDLTDPVIEEAETLGAGLIITHHPPLFKPLETLRWDLAAGARLRRLAAAGISVYASHTNLDTAEGGVNDILADALGLVDREPLLRSGEEALYKVAVFVPEDHADNVRNALSAAGAGWIGNYSHCTFQAPGTGTFLPREGSDPFIGAVGRLERVAEVRLETVVPEPLLRRALRAMIDAHPYEEVAYDVYRLANEGRVYGIGRLGRLPEAVRLDEFAVRVRRVTAGSGLRVLGDPAKTVRKVAVLGGAGGEYVGRAADRGADVFVTAEVKHHQGLEALDRGLAVIDAGHFGTERPVVQVVRDRLAERIRAEGIKDLEVWASEREGDPWRFLA